MFSESKGFNFSEKSADYRSWVGSLASLLVFVLTLAATVQNIMILHKRDGTLIIEALDVKKNDETRIFTQDDGFKMAIAIYDYSYTYQE